ncbi:flagellar hook-associated protein FlgK [bacterium]|nr:flagellar hook-associated protein FlgK [bacterium]
MSRLSDIMQSGRSALRIQQLAMQVIGQNTANVNTEGYSRRRLDLTLAPPFDNIGRWHAGGGVDVDYLGRVRDRLLDEQVRRAGSEYGYWSLRDETLTRVEEIFSELGGSAISDQLQEFWSAWQDLANDPEAMGTRYSLLQKAQTLAASFRRANAGVLEQRSQVDDQFAAAVRDVNRLTGEIAGLNVEIVRSELGGQEASDLRDARDLAIDRLSRLMNITVRESDDGSVSVYNGGQMLVDRESNVELYLSKAADGRGTRNTVSYGANGQPLNVSSGELKALMQLRDDDLGQTLADLDTFAITIASRVNEIHRTGYGLTGTNGIDFFEQSLTGAADFRIGSLILDDAARIAAAVSPDSPGDNSLALQIAGIQQEKLLGSGRSTLDDFYRNSVLRIGSAKSFAAGQLQIEQAAMDNLENRRQQVSGVSMDEEMTNLIKVQQAYDAAAKIIKTVDEMMKTVLSLGASG